MFYFGDAVYGRASGSDGVLSIYLGAWDERFLLVNWFILLDCSFSFSVCKSYMIFVLE